MTDAIPNAHDALRAELVGLMDEVMRQPRTDPATVTDDTPCVGGALLRDSLDVLEFVVALDRVHGLSLRDADAARIVLQNMGALTRCVAEHRAARSAA
jgi:acyl carrier protein